MGLTKKWLRMQECLIWVALDEIVHEAEVVEVDPSLLSRAEFDYEKHDEIEIEANVEHASQSSTERSDSIETRFARLERSMEVTWGANCSDYE